MNKFEILFYQKANGEEPAKDFILQQDPKMKAKLLRIIEMIGTNGNVLGEPYTKSLSDGIYEIRAKHSSDITRVLYFFEVGGRIVLTNGFVKKTDKTPRREIETAKKYRNDYRRRARHDQI
ncbi:type II toxin-antitoxin system RelE/ParE family toxin [Clostridium sp. AN503]|uniref:type II toxin-antitoxin system RelE/ParE family toxin n=1 Tax=Clostridium sp. AN503 TaxID=3160598 RepID=UPI00345AE8D6